MPTFAPVNYKNGGFTTGRCSNSYVGLRAAREVGHPAEPQVERGDEQFGFRVGCSFFVGMNIFFTPKYHLGGHYLYVVNRITVFQDQRRGGHLG